MQMAITCYKCKRRFKPDEIIAKLVHNDDITYYCWNHVKGVAKLLKDGARLEYMKAGNFQSEIDARFRRDIDPEYIPPSRKKVIPKSPEQEILDILKKHNGLRAFDVFKLQGHNKANSNVYKRLRHMTFDGKIKERDKRYYVD